MSTECESAEPSRRRRKATTHEWTGENPQNLFEVLGVWTPLSDPKQKPYHHGYVFLERDYSKPPSLVMLVYLCF